MTWAALLPRNRQLQRRVEPRSLLRFSTTPMQPVRKWPGSDACNCPRFQRSPRRGVDQRPPYRRSAHRMRHTRIGWQRTWGRSISAPFRTGGPRGGCRTCGGHSHMPPGLSDSGTTNRGSFNAKRTGPSGITDLPSRGSNRQDGRIGQLGLRPIHSTWHQADCQRAPDVLALGDRFQIPNAVVRLPSV